MSLVNLSIICILSSTFILTLLFYELYLLEKKSYLKLWSLAWGIYTLRFIFELFITSHNNFLYINQLTALSSSLLLLWGTYGILSKKMPSFWMVIFILSFFWEVAVIWLNFPFYLLALPVLIHGVVSIWTGVVFLSVKNQEKTGKFIVGLTFILWGINKISFPIARGIAWYAPWGYFFGALCEIVIGMGLILFYFQKTRQELNTREEHFRLLSEELKRTNTFLTAQQDAAIDGILVVDDHSKIISYNIRFLNMFQITPEYIKKHNSNERLKKHISPYIENKEYFIKETEEFYNNPQKTLHDELHILDGRLIERYTGPVISQDGVYYGRIWFHRDITERRRAEEELHAEKSRTEDYAKDLADKYQELEQFAYVVSHDLKAPLRAINNLAEWLEDDLSEMLTQDSREKMALLRGRVKRMENLINGILEYSRVGRPVVEKKK